MSCGCRHDFQPMILDRRNAEPESVRAWCVKCDLSVDIERRWVSHLYTIAERVRDPKYPC